MDMINGQQYGMYQEQPMYPQGGYVQPQVGYTPYATQPQQPGGVYAPMFGGPMYGQQVQPGTNPIPQNVINEMLKTGTGSQLHLDEMDLLKAKCTHRNPAQNKTTLSNAGHDGMVHCDICGAEFHLLENVSHEDVAKAAQNVCDILHTMKVMWRDIPDRIAEEYFQVEAVVKQIPQMFNIASQALQKYNENYMGYQNPQMNGFAALGSVIGGAPMGGMMGMQPMMGYQQPYGYPVGQQIQQPAFDPNYMNPQAQQMTQAAPGMSNGFGVMAPPQQQPVMNLQPQQQQAVSQPAAQPTQQAAPVPAPVAPAPAPTEGARVTETLQV